MSQLDIKEFDAKTGILSFRIRKSDGGWHRITIQPGDDVDYILKCNNAHLESMGNAKIDDDSIANIKKTIKYDHTPLVIEKFKAAQAVKE